MHSTTIAFDAHQLLGGWTAAVGTFAAIMDERWWFGANGTGTASFEALSGTSELRFQWWPLEDGVVQLRVVSWLGDDEADDEAGPGPWERRHIESARGPDEFRREIQTIWTSPGDGFWLGNHPLTRA